jgi:VWFA-related protein
MQNRRAWYLAFVVAGLACAPGAAAQAPPPDAPKPQLIAPMSVEVVRIEVVVTDKRRKPIADLTRDDFVILEEGRAQPIVQFQAFTRRVKPSASPGAEPALAEEADEAQLPARYIVLVIDDVHMQFDSLARLQKAMSRFIQTDLRPEDQVALVTTSGAGAVAQEFTADRETLRATLSRLSIQDRRQAGFHGAPYLSEYQAELIERNDPLAVDAAVQETMAAGMFQDADSAERYARQKARAILTEAVYAARLTLETLEGLTRGLANLSGRKVIFLVSDGFLTGISYGTSTTYDIRRIADAATKSGVVMYALDTRGLQATPPIAPAWSNRTAQGANAGLVDAMQRRGFVANSDSMNALANDTGGFLVENSNDLRGGLKEILDDTEAYYVLAYEPTERKQDGRFRKIEVKLPKTPGVRVRTRSGYFSPADPKLATALPTAEAEARRAEQRRAEIKTALYSLAPLNAIPVRLNSDFVSVDRGVTRLVVSGRIDLAPVPFVKVRDHHQTVLEAVAVVCDEAGGIVKTLPTDRSVLDLDDEGYERVLRTGLPYQKDVELGPGRYQVRFAAREDATGLLGSARHWIEIPDLGPGRLEVSSVFLLRDAAAAGAASSPGAPSLGTAQALRYYEQGESLYAQLYAYNPKRDASGQVDLVSQAEILHDGKLLGRAAPEPMASSDPAGPPVAHTTRIKLDRFDPGDYELRVTVTDRIANAMVTRRVGFTID